MRVIIQRVSSGGVTVEGQQKREIGPGLVVLLGVTDGDDGAAADYLAEKTVNLRIFEDEAGLMNRSLLDVGGDCLIVSNFTLYADCKKGRRPSFADAARPEVSEPLYRAFVEAVKAAGAAKVVTGEFGAMMAVDIQNDGPVTVIVDSK
ncbi:D-tyrosyl-tRNA(Tyr) deacylase [Bacteroides sp. OttesenSCG-928-J23]|nr:D-tyrosyl-tRNA(Tyr) deacylase [Bacteroides sp. OttesenSCG-928-J23]